MMKIFERFWDNSFESEYWVSFCENDTKDGN